MRCSEGSLSEKGRGEMLGTYKTTDFDNLFADLQAELDRLRNGYNPYSKSRAVNIHDYNHLTTCLLKMRDIKTEEADD